MAVAVKAEGMGSGVAELSKALFAIDVVSVGRNQQTTGLELDAVAWAKCESGPFCKNRRKMIDENLAACETDKNGKLESCQRVVILY